MLNAVNNNNNNNNNNDNNNNNNNNNTVDACLLGIVFTLVINSSSLKGNWFP